MLQRGREALAALALEQGAGLHQLGELALGFWLLAVPWAPSRLPALPRAPPPGDGPGTAGAEHSACWVAFLVETAALVWAGCVWAGAESVSAASGWPRAEAACWHGVQG